MEREKPSFMEQHLEAPAHDRPALQVPRSWLYERTGHKVISDACGRAMRAHLAIAASGGQSGIRAGLAGSSHSRGPG